jgi:hypothetical protein
MFSNKESTKKHAKYWQQKVEKFPKMTKRNILFVAMQNILLFVQ